MPLGAGRSAAGDPGLAVPSLARQKQASTAERRLGASRGRRRSGLRQAAHRAPTVSALSPRPLAAQGPGATTAGHLGSLAAWAPPHRCCRLSEATRVHERFGGTTAFHRPPGRGAWRCPPCPASQEKRGPSGRMKLIWETRGPGEKGRATVCELEPHLMVTSSAPTAPNPLPGEVQGPVGRGRRPGRRPHPRPLPCPGSRRGMSVAIPGQRAVHRSPGSLSAGRAGPPPLCLPCPPPGGGTRQLSLHSELGLACFCPFCLPYTLNLIEFQGRFQSHLEYGKKKKREYGHKSKGGSLHITGSPAQHGRGHPAFTLHTGGATAAGKAQVPATRGPQANATCRVQARHPWSEAGQPLGCRITPRVPRSTDNYAALKYLLNLSESGGGLSHCQTIKANYVGKYCCHHGV